MNASALAPGRWRCHAAVADGHIHLPGLVSVGADGSVEATPFTSETHTTRDINAVVLVVRPETLPLLPASLPPRGMRAALTELIPLTIGGSIAVAIPLSAI